MVHEPCGGWIPYPIDAVLYFYVFGKFDQQIGLIQQAIFKPTNENGMEIVLW